MIEIDHKIEILLRKSYLELMDFCTTIERFVIFRGEGPSRTRIGKKEREREIHQKVAISIAGSYV